MTKSVYRANVNTGANVVKMAGNLTIPVDIHAYMVVPKQRKFVSFIYPTQLLFYDSDMSQFIVNWFSHTKIVNDH